jgi:hypothetical protein
MLSPYQPPTRGLDALAVKRLERVELETPVLHALEAAAPARVAATLTTSS